MLAFVVYESLFLVSSFVPFIEASEADLDLGVGRSKIGLQFSTPGVMHDDMDNRRNHIQTDETVQFVQAFCRCPDILGIHLLGSAVRSVLCLTPVFTGQLVSFPSIHIGFCGTNVTKT